VVKRIKSMSRPFRGALLLVWAVGLVALIVGLLIGHVALAGSGFLMMGAFYVFCELFVDWRFLLKSEKRFGVEILCGKCKRPECRGGYRSGFAG
jgi:hypothetical protein